MNQKVSNTKLVLIHWFLELFCLSNGDPNMKSSIVQIKYQCQSTNQKLGNNTKQILSVHSLAFSRFHPVPLLLLHCPLPRLIVREWNVRHNLYAKGYGVVLLFRFKSSIHRKIKIKNPWRCPHGTLPTLRNYEHRVGHARWWGMQASLGPLRNHADDWTRPFSHCGAFPGS